MNQAKDECYRHSMQSALKVAHTLKGVSCHHSSLCKQISCPLTDVASRLRSGRSDGHSLSEQWKNCTVATCSRNVCRSISPVCPISLSPKSKVHRKGSRLWRLIMQAKLYENEGARDPGLSVKTPHSIASSRGVARRCGVATLHVIDWSRGTAKCEILCYHACCRQWMEVGSVHGERVQRWKRVYVEERDTWEVVKRWESSKVMERWRI
jgi:hypothetical protein